MTQFSDEVLLEQFKHIKNNIGILDDIKLELIVFNKNYNNAYQEIKINSIGIGLIEIKNSNLIYVKMFNNNKLSKYYMHDGKLFKSDLYNILKISKKDYYSCTNKFSNFTNSELKRMNLDVTKLLII